MERNNLNISFEGFEKVLETALTEKIIYPKILLNAREEPETLLLLAYKKLSIKDRKELYSQYSKIKNLLLNDQLYTNQLSEQTEDTDSVDPALIPYISSQYNKFQNYLQHGLGRYLIFLLLAHPRIQENLKTKILIKLEPHINSFEKILNILQGVPIIDSLKRLEITGSLELGSFTEMKHHIRFNIDQPNSLSTVIGSSYSDEEIKLNTAGINKTTILN